MESKHLFAYICSPNLPPNGLYLGKQFSKNDGYAPFSKNNYYKMGNDRKSISEIKYLEDKYIKICCR